MLRAVLALVVVALLSACTGRHVWAPDDQVAAARHVAGPPAAISLFTTINDRNGSGAHAALLINGSERVLFDPAGTWQMPGVPERDDVHFGMTDRAVSFYRDYHARDSATEKFHLVERRMTVPPEIAELVLERAKAYGPVPPAFCAHSVATILRGVPGFESLPVTMFPVKLGNAFGELPGVETMIFTEENDNPGPGHGIVMVDRKGNQVD